MRDKVRILLGVLIISAVSCLSYFGLLELVSYRRDLDVTGILSVILDFGILALTPFIGSIVRVSAGYICKKKLGFGLFQSKMIQLISCFLCLIEVNLYANSYCRTLGFEEGLGFVLGLFFMLIVTALEILLSIVILVIQHKKRQCTK